jgi:hypothetical protein
MESRKPPHSHPITKNISQTIAQAAELIVTAFDAEGIKIADSLGMSSPELSQAISELEAKLLSLAMQRGVAQFDVSMSKMEHYFAENKLISAGELRRRLNLSQREFLVACEMGLIKPAQTPYDYGVLTPREPLSLYYPADLSLSQAQRLALQDEMHKIEAKKLNPTNKDT